MIPFKALLVEGTSGVGKSTLIDALTRHHGNASAPRKIRTFVHLAQSHTYGPLAMSENEGGLTVAANLQHLERIVATIEWLRASVREHARPWCFVLVDTLHLTHCVRPGVVEWRDVEPFDQRLARSGCKMLFLQATSGAIWERGIKPRRGEQFLEEYARKFGRTEEEIHAYFVREQEKLAGLFSCSAMPKLLLHNDGTAESALDEAYRFWTEDRDEAGASRESAPHAKAGHKDEVQPTRK